MLLTEAGNRHTCGPSCKYTSKLRGSQEIVLRIRRVRYTDTSTAHVYLIKSHKLKKNFITICIANENIVYYLEITTTLNLRIHHTQINYESLHMNN